MNGVMTGTSGARIEPSMEKGNRQAAAPAAQQQQPAMMQTRGGSKVMFLILQWNFFSPANAGLIEGNLTI